MNRMFFRARLFNQDIGSWNVSNVTNMRQMFEDAVDFNQDISAWDVSNVNNMIDMFKEVSGFSVANYDALLTGWSALTLQQGITISGNRLQYCTAEDARQSIIDTYGWTINDAGKVAGCSTASIDDVENILFTVYPNPIDSNLFIKGINTPVAISIYNILGKEVIYTKNTNNIDVKALPSGVYIIKISDGVRQTNRKFIKN
jgi:surface protein